MTSRTLECIMWTDMESVFVQIKQAQMFAAAFNLKFVVSTRINNWILCKVVNPPLWKFWAKPVMEPIIEDAFSNVVKYMLENLEPYTQEQFDTRRKLRSAIYPSLGEYLLGSSGADL